MMSPRFFSGVSLFALLIVDICCVPVNKGFNPSASHGSSQNAPNFGANQGAPGAVLPYAASSGGVAPSPQHVPHAQAAPVDFNYGASSGPVSSAGMPEVNWAVAPPSLSSSAPSEAQFVSPPGPEFKAGELAHYEDAYEAGFSERETAEQGYLPPQPFAVHGSAGPAFTSQPFPAGPRYFYLPYPYDYRFLTGQYPPGTVTHYSSSYEEGEDQWEDSHYWYHDEPAFYDETVTDFQQPPVKAGQTRSQTGSYNPPKRGY